MGQTSGQKQAGKYIGQAGGQIDALAASQAASPLYQLGYALAKSVGENPLTMGPEVTDKIKRTAMDTASNSYAQNTAQLQERFGATGNAGSGYAYGAQRDEALRLGGKLGDISRDVDVAAAQQRRQDEASAISILQAMLGVEQAPFRDKANILAGGAALPVWSQPSAGASLGQGLGSLAGTVAGAEKGSLINKG